MPELAPKRVEQMTAVTFDARWKPKRREVTYRIGKRGTSAFLLFSDAELMELRRLIDSAVGARHDRDT
jgi:hypothetical protein